MSSSPSPDPFTDWNHTTPAATGFTEGGEEEEEEGEGEGEEGEGEREEEGAFSGSCGSVASAAEGPQMYECEGGGYQVDPATISSSPIRFQRQVYHIMNIHELLCRSFRRITELDPLERAGYYNQFTKKGRGGQRGRERGTGTGPSGAGYMSTRRGGVGRRGGGGGGGRGRGGGNGGRGKRRGKHYHFRGRGKRN